MMQVMYHEWTKSNLTVTAPFHSNRLTLSLTRLSFSVTWWEVDLGEGVAVSRVVIYNRNDGDAAHASDVSRRLSNSDVSLINYQGNTLKTYRIGDATNVPVFDINFAGINGVLITKAPTPAPITAPTPLTDSFPLKNVFLSDIGFNKYLSADVLIINWKYQGQAWEKWTITKTPVYYSGTNRLPLSDRKYFIVSHHNKFLSGQPNGSVEFRDSGGDLNSWERWTIKKIAHDYVEIESQHGHNLMNAEHWKIWSNNDNRVTESAVNAALF